MPLGGTSFEYPDNQYGILGVDGGGVSIQPTLCALYLLMFTVTSSRKHRFIHVQCSTVD